LTDKKFTSLHQTSSNTLSVHNQADSARRDRQMYEHERIEELLENIKAGQCSIEDALSILDKWKTGVDRCVWPDQYRQQRTGIPEVVYGENKSDEQLYSIFQKMLHKPGPVMATRVNREKAAYVARFLPEALYYEQAAMLVARSQDEGYETVAGEIVVVTAGTSDIPVAEEARVTVYSLGHPVQTLYDIGIAGIHRLYESRNILKWM